MTDFYILWTPSFLEWVMLCNSKFVRINLLCSLLLYRDEKYSAYVGVT